MLATFVIGLREGLEAALIVGIVAAFLRRRGQLAMLRWVFAGVGVGVAVCLAVAVGLELVSQDLPQRQQEGLETVIGLVAVGMVTYMVVWMKRHARELAQALDQAAGRALSRGSGWALVGMAFLAVLREGLETAVFLLAAFHEADNARAAGAGALAGLAVAVGIGWGIYRGGIRLNLSKFFRGTGVVLVLVAAGLVMSALRTAHEAGWLQTGQQPTVDLSWLVRPGSVSSSLLTGMLGLTPRPVLIELVGWLAYLVPMTLYVAWPAARRPSAQQPGTSPRPGPSAQQPGASAQRPGVSALTGTSAGTGATPQPPGSTVLTTHRPRVATIALAIGTALAAVAVGCLLARPPAPGPRPLLQAGGLTAQVVSREGSHARIAATIPGDSTGAGGPVEAARTTAGTLDGAPVEYFEATETRPVTGRPSGLTGTELAALAGGRLPLGLSAGPDRLPVRYVATAFHRFALAGERVLDVRWRVSTTALARTLHGEVPVAVAGGGSGQLAAEDVARAVHAANVADADAGRRGTVTTWAAVTGLGAVSLFLTGGLLGAGHARRRPVRELAPVLQPARS